MSRRKNDAEKWTIGFKITLLAYVVAEAYVSALTITPWFLLAVLFYLSLNVAYPMFKQPAVQRLLVLASMLLILVAGLAIDPLLLLLLPANLYELLSSYVRPSGLLLLPMLAPAALVPGVHYPAYGFTAILAYAYFGLLTMHTERIDRYWEQQERMQAELNRLKNRLHENDAYIRQFESMYKLEERNRLSQEIHDKIGHSMTGALIQMEAAKRLMATDAGKSGELLQNAIAISKEGIESIRQVLKNMKPPPEQLGINRLRLFLEEFSSQHPIRTVLTHEGNVDRITPLHWKIIQDNVTEALTNTLKYAEATSVAVHIEVLRTLIKANVTDNGRGMPKIRKGLGIGGMEERAAIANGTVIVDGSRGFSVTTLLPCDDDTKRAP